jgi:predicted Rossmann fold flavoprotein
MCAIHAGRRGKKVLLLDHAKKIGGKILISGGGRCNFTNTGASPNQYVSQNQHFCKSALSRFTPADFIALVEKHEIPFHEKKLGQLFCDRSAGDIVNLLLNEVKEAGAEILLETQIVSVNHSDMFYVQTSTGTKTAKSLVVATGGLSVPKVGATGIGYEIAKQFGLAVTPLAPALDGFTFKDKEAQRFAELSGLSVDCKITTGGQSFRENFLFTHRGLSGPAALQASLHWYANQSVEIILVPDLNLATWLVEQKRSGLRMTIKNVLGQHLPKRFAELLVDEFFPQDKREQALADLPDLILKDFAAHLQPWTLVPQGTVGYSKAEVTRGGVATDELSSKNMSSHKVPDLYFIGEVVDVTGWLGGYNFQWAWASGAAAGNSI